MEKLTITEKLLSIITMLISVFGTSLTKFYMPDKFLICLIVTIIICLIILVYLIVKVIKQKKYLNKLNVPFFRDWYLQYTMIWRKYSEFLHNNVLLDEVRIVRVLHGGDEYYKDNSPKYTFKGKYEGTANYFVFCIAGLGDDCTTLSDINFKAFDKRNYIELQYSLASDIPDNIVKFVRISFVEEKQKGDFFDIELSWTWPRTMFAKKDYFAFPNIYGNKTKKLILEFKCADDMEIECVETHKLGLNDAEVSFLKRLYSNDDLGRIYIHEINNPEQGADYITYYEQKPR